MSFLVGCLLLLCLGVSSSIRNCSKKAHFCLSFYPRKNSNTLNPLSLMTFSLKLKRVNLVKYSYLSSYWSETFVYDHIAFTVATNTETMTRHNYSNGKIKGCAQTMNKNCIGGKSWFQIMRHLHQGLSWCESYTFKLNILQNRDSVVNSPLRVTHFSF